LTERSTARHRATQRSTTPLSTITGSLSVVGDYVGSVRRSGVIIAMSSGLVASMALPAHAVGSAPVDAGGPQTASIPAVPSSADGAAFFAAPEGGLLSLPADLAGSDGPVTAPNAATVAFDHTAFVAVPGDQDARTAVEPQLGQPTASATPKVSLIGDDAPQSRRQARAKAGGQAATPASSSSSSSSAAVPASASGSHVVAVAMRYEGVPYVWGGQSPLGFDCSGFTRYVYSILGHHLPRTVAEQRSAVRIVSRSQARPGDLVIFGSSHVGIYVGHGKMIDAPHRGRSVTVRDIYSANAVFGRV
jgi:cell wall-associated NlpC family hydrolase